MRLNKNLGSLNVYRSYIRTLEEYSTSMNRISSGTKLNKAKDNPNKLAQSERIRLQLRSLEMASRNAQDAVSMVQSADGVMNSITSSLQRLRELSIQGGSGTMNDNDKAVIEIEMKQIVDSIQSMAEQGDFNGVNLVGDTTVTDNKNPKSIRVTVGGNVGEEAYLDAYNLTSQGLGLMNDKGEMLISLDDIDGAIEKIDAASEVVLSARSKNGAKQNRFENMYNGLLEMRDRNMSTDSKIRDTDVAEESITLAKADVLINASASIMAQTNKFPQDILRILENVRGR